MANSREDALVESYDNMKIGILALQGDYEAHARVLKKLDVEYSYVRTPADLNGVHGMILPGGESSTLLKLLQQNGLFDALYERLKKGMPFFGTCAGAILLAKTVISPAQISLNAVDVTILRNAYGRQLASQMATGHCILNTTPLPLFFIRAPKFIDLAPDIKIIATYQGDPVCIQQHACLLATFHPELTQDATLHLYFLELVRKTAIPHF